MTDCLLGPCETTREIRARARPANLQYYQSYRAYLQRGFMTGNNEKRIDINDVTVQVGSCLRPPPAPNETASGAALEWHTVKG